MIPDFSWRRKKMIRPWYKGAFSLASTLSDDLEVLELGSGLGEFAPMLKTKFSKITCCDGEPTYVKELEKKGYNTYQFDFNQKFPFKNNRFDLVITLEVIEHLVEPANFIDEIKRILRKKGYLLISTPNISWFGFRFFSLIGRPPFRAGYHFQFYNFYTFKKLLINNGFSLKKTASITPIPLLARLVLQLTQKSFHLKIDHWQNMFAQHLIFLLQKK